MFSTSPSTGTLTLSEVTDDEIEQIVGGVSFKIPHSDEVYKQFLSGNLFGGLTEKDSKDFRKAVSKIANEVFEL